MAGKVTIQQTRALVLALLVATALITGGVYLFRARRATASQPLPLPRVAPNTTQSAGFRLSKSDQGRIIFTLKALRAREQRDMGKILLEEVEIITFGTQGNRHDRIFSKLCEYDAHTGQVYSEGEVEIELASLPGELPAAAEELVGTPASPVGGARLARIHARTSGVTFNEKTGVASTERPVQFRFFRGTGQATGVVYNSYQRTLRLTSAVRIQVQKPGAPEPSQNRVSPLEIQAEELVYLQRESQIRLRRPRMRQELAGGGSRELLGEQATLRLDEQNHVQAAEVVGQVRMHESVAGAHPGEERQTRMRAERLDLVFNEQQLVEQACLNQAVRLDVVTPRSRAEFQAGSLGAVFRWPAEHPLQGGVERRSANRTYANCGRRPHPRAHQ